jgi:orotate phosphoribosyltransferase
MGDAAANEFLSLVSSRTGHFRLESGHHSRRWLDLDGLFADPTQVAPLVHRLAEQLRGHDVVATCGPLVGGALLAQALSADLRVAFSFTERVPEAESEGLYRAGYRLPPALRKQVQGKRVAIVDDVVSAGSAVRGTHAELLAHGARPVVVGALLELGTMAAEFFTPMEIPVASVFRLPYDVWRPVECPLCAWGAPLEDVAAGTAVGS